MLTFFIIFTIVALILFFICMNIDGDVGGFGRVIFLFCFFIGLVGCAQIADDNEKREFMQECTIDLAPKVCEEIYYDR